MVTSFFGRHSFGGDAAYVDRLSRALLDRGYEVDVVHNVDAFEALRGRQGQRHHEPHPRLGVFPVRRRLGRLDLLWTHQTSRAGRHRRALETHFRDGRYDVIHFHNVSLMGGLGGIEIARRSSPAVRLLSAHDHWLTCPLSLLWRLDREVCERPTCVRCTLAAGRPPQWWRWTSVRERMLDQVDQLVVSTDHARRMHLERGVDRSFAVLPYFLPDSWVAAADHASPFRGRDGRPYLAAAGRLVREKGFQTVIERMGLFEDVDLFLAGDGPMRGELERLADRYPNVFLLGMLDQSRLRSLMRGAVAVVVPSLFFETFGYVALEAMAAATPVIVHDLGPLPEHVERSGAGYSYSTLEQLERRMRELVENEQQAREMGRRGRGAVRELWNEEDHVRRYRELVEGARAARDSQQIFG